VIWAKLLLSVKYVLVLLGILIQFRSQLLQLQSFLPKLYTSLLEAFKKKVRSKRSLKKSTLVVFIKFVAPHKINYCFACLSVVNLFFTTFLHLLVLDFCLSFVIATYKSAS